MKKENKSQYAILGLLSKRAYSGYEMKEKINKIAHFHWAESNAQLYPMLKQLEQEGKVSSQIDLSSGARQKRIYQITDLGIESLKNWLLQPVQQPQYREELVLKVALGEHLPKEKLLAHLHDYIIQLEEKNRLLNNMVNHIQTQHSNRPDKPYLDLTYDYAKMIIQAKLDWAKQTIQKLQKN